MKDFLRQQLEDAYIQDILCDMADSLIEIFTEGNEKDTDLYEAARLLYEAADRLW